MNSAWLASPQERRTTFLTQRDHTLGPDHPHVARSLYNLAQLYSRQHCYTKAEPLYLQAIRIQEKSLSTDPAQIAATLTGYARLLRKTKRKTKAEAMTIRAKRMWIQNGTTSQTGETVHVQDLNPGPKNSVR
jgi:tetratricopeptide (TPR) repeat protein